MIINEALLNDKTRNIKYEIDTETLIPRCQKAKEEQKSRTKSKAEVFTPTWICNQMLNHIDNDYFGKNVFNVEKDKTYTTITDKIPFKDKDDFINYISRNAIEITCGEGPFIVSRYDTTTGEPIPVKDRIGYFDRKLRTIYENTDNEEEYEDLVILALKHSYGYEYQVDNLLICRENILQSILEHKEYKFNTKIFKKMPEILDIICWNFFQMDGLKYTIPETEIFAKIMDWDSQEIIEFRTLAQ